MPSTYFCVECAYESTGRLLLWFAMFTVKLAVLPAEGVVLGVRPPTK